MTQADSAYHRPGDTLYHLDVNCAIGREIPYEWREKGTAGLALCPTCHESQRIADVHVRDEASSH